MRLAKSLGSVLAMVLLAGLILLLASGKPKPIGKQKKVEPPAIASASQGVKDAFEFAKEIDEKLRGEPRFSKVYLVPSAATQQHTYGKVMVMGEVQTDEDMAALQDLVVRDGIRITTEWQVSVFQRPR